MKKLVIGIAVVAVVAILIVLNLRSSRGGTTAVEVEAVSRRDVTRVVTASGNIQPRRRVNVSASAMGKVTRVAVVEGQTVERGDFLLEIDPTAYRSSVEQLEAAVRGARAARDLERASLKKAQYDLQRATDLHEKGFASEESLRDAEIAVEVATARVASAEEQLSQYSANLVKARHELNEVRITAEMAGVITALNVEEGESAIIGTMNNPGTVLLTISDLSAMQAEVLVDETEVVLIAVGQHAAVRLDAYPDTTYSGRVTKVANSSVRSQLGMGQESVDFEVVVSIEDEIPNIRPGLSASVDIRVADASDVLSVPIQSLTVRADPAAADSTADDEVEGVFLIDDRTARFRPVRIGITGETHFSVVSGLAEGDRIVVGPFSAINDLRDGDPVKVEENDD